MPNATEDAIGFCFYEDAIPEWGIAYMLLAEDVEGDVWYPARPIIEALGVQRTTQTGILQTDARTRKGVKEISAPTRGGKQKAIYVRRKECAIWLTLIDPEKVAERARGKIEDFQGALWQLADKIVFRRKRISDAATEGPTTVAYFHGDLHTDTACPICEGSLDAELGGGAEGIAIRLSPK
jgi:hypothetical protein